MQIDTTLRDDVLVIAIPQLRIVNNRLCGFGDLLPQLRRETDDDRSPIFLYLPICWYYGTLKGI